MATTTTNPATTSPSGRYYALVLIVLAGGLWATSIWWWPYAGALLGFAKPVEDKPKAAAGGEPITEIQLSNEALETFDVKIGTLKPSTYERIVPIPARTKAIPGRGRQEVTSSASGIIRRIFVGVGDMVAPRDPLFELQLVHDETVKTQVELLDAIAEREVVSAEITRLEALEKRTPGAVPGTRLIEKKYERQHLNHMIASRRQMLILLGVPESSVDDLIDSHLKEHRMPPGDGHDDYRDKPLVESVTIYAPVMPSSIDGETKFLVEDLPVVLGQHIESGDVLCRLGDYTRLWIEGDAFERDLETLRTARDNAWPVAAAIERRGRAPLVIDDLTIKDIAPLVDAESRSAQFWVELKNELRELPAVENQASRIDWKFRPGQRMELRVPTELMHDVLKMPVEAVAQDGLNNYVFQVLGKNAFKRHPVQVLERDEDYVVIAPSKVVAPGVKIALSGAFQLQLALLNKSIDPAAIAHGHAH